MRVLGNRAACRSNTEFTTSSYGRSNRPTSRPSAATTGTRRFSKYRPRVDWKRPPLVDQAWLRTQAQLQYRQNCGSQPSDYRLHLIGRQRLLSADASSRPQRLAHMLLVCDDFLRGRNDLDFFEARLFASPRPLAAASGSLQSLCIDS